MKDSELIVSAPPDLCIRTVDAVHLTTAHETGEREVWTNDRHMLASASCVRLAGLCLNQGRNQLGSPQSMKPGVFGYNQPFCRNSWQAALIAGAAPPQLAARTRPASWDPGIIQPACTTRHNPVGIPSKSGWRRSRRAFCCAIRPALARPFDPTGTSSRLLRPDSEMKS
jgi:hypothetical protein